MESKSPGDDLQRRRVPRLNLTTEQFRHAQNGRIFSVADLSIDGMALRVLDRNDLALFPVGVRFEGTLNIRRNKFPIKAQVRHLGTEMVGCAFDDLNDKTREIINSFLDPAVLGQELKPIPATDGVALWYHGPSGTDLLLWRSADGQYVRMMLFVLGSYAQWDVSGGVVTGRLSASFERSEIRGVIRLETMLLQPDEKPDADKLNVARVLLLHSPLPEDLKGWCARHFTVKE
jgi:hypothetical protein